MTQKSKSIEREVFDLLRSKGMTFASAESCTGGNIAHLITLIPGSSEVFRGAAVTYATPTKTKVLGVPKEVIEAMCPNLSDEVLLGYSPSQLQWAEEFEGDLWADMVGSQCLYSSDMEVYRTFLADGPFTNEYSHDAPARLGEFVGLHIIRSYVEAHPDYSLRDLMKERDLQGLFQESRYKPKK